MNKTVFFILPLCAGLLAFVFWPKEPVYKSTEGVVTFFSEAPLENIDATSKGLVSAINTGTNEVVFSVGMRSFQFRKAKMQQDFNVNFMQSEKYPVATYTGLIREKIDWEKDGTYAITSKGTLTVHGVPRERIDTGVVSIRNGRIMFKSNFYVRVADHQIKVPKLLFQKIAEVVKVKVAVDYSELPPTEVSSAP